MHEFFSKTRTFSIQAEKIPIYQKSALGVFQFLQSIPSLGHLYVAGQIEFQSKLRLIWASGN